MRPFSFTFHHFHTRVSFSSHWMASDLWPANASLVLEAIFRRGKAWCNTVEYLEARNLKPWIIHLWHFNECEKSLPIIHNLHSCCNVTLLLWALSGVSNRPCDTSTCRDGVGINVRRMQRQRKTWNFCNIYGTILGTFPQNYTVGNKKHLRIFILVSKIRVIYQQPSEKQYPDCLGAQEQGIV